MKNITLLFLTLTSIFCLNIYSQKAKLELADKKYDRFAYIDAIKTYERIAEKGYRSADLFEKLGNSYYFNAQLEDAAKWYKELFATTTEVKPEIYYRYAQSLRSIGENKKADSVMLQFAALSSDDTRAELYTENQNYLNDIEANTGKYNVEKTNINTEFYDYGSSFYGKKLVFTSSRSTGGKNQKKHTWTNQYYTNIFVAELDEQLNPSNPVPLNNTINSKYNESTPVFTKDGTTMYFTRNNYLDGKKGKNENNTTLLKIYRATLKDDKWSNIVELPFNSDDFSTAHPALSPDEKTLYFASDRPGTLGLSDIYSVSIKGIGTYGKPKNLGSKINTPGRETFPFINEKNEIFFASDGHPGLGGLDIFTSKIEDENFGDVHNIGADINSPDDDFGYLIDHETQRGFFTSNKPGGLGFDDIYKFLKIEIKKKPVCVQELFGQITDIDTKEVLPDTKLTLFDKDFNEVSSFITDQNGNYSIKVDCGKVYHLRAEKDKYNTREEKAITNSEDGKTQLDIALERITCKVALGDDLGKCFGIKMIYFDLNKSDIRPEAAIDLEKILDVMNHYPYMKIDIRSHTDCRASFKYNEALSDRRAKSTVAWLVKRGIKADRLTGKGYGESQLVNKCSDGVSCTEEEHQLNRRSEFIITEL
ncbi:OmpA family protein [Flavobacterium sp. 7A]|uniref:OmpA family protein n=1 Tax=Flavobacterium sp. 7A TaxID=2940571 RepID=UPI002227DC3B|nr:OmpA family protein [Flavobacterium sp. 7A]MCW2120885.1 outer membrane protein OmpA-like peptidoglycan-associated protein/Tol biopolymer transport system component [Flavobacterium sp. 7A]